MIFQMILFSVPEAMIVTWLVYVLSGAKVDLKRILLIGVLVGVCLVLIRPLIDVYLLNVIIYGFALVLMLSLFKVASFWERLTSVALSMSIYIVTEFLNITIISSILQVDPLTVMVDNIFTRFLWFLPQIIIVSLVALILQKKKITLFDHKDKWE
ncbi:MAG: hypothetical protein FH749_02340 [Firmicutes bacterium]|nr:hypothetical protein [Bacillota bacterium]